MNRAVRPSFAFARQPASRAPSPSGSRLLAALLVLGFALAALPVRAEDTVEQRADAIEAYLPAFPGRAIDELVALAPPAAPLAPATRRHVDGLLGEALIAAGRNGEALEIADRLERTGDQGADPAQKAEALLLRAAVQQWAGDTGKAHALALEARTLAAPTGDLFVRHWAALLAGTTARQRGENDDALAELEEARLLADQAGNAYRRANALYALSVLYRQLPQPAKSLEAAVASYKDAAAAKSVYALARAKMAESAAEELLGHPKPELAALQEALAIGRNAGSPATESLALTNLADISLRRKDYRAAYEQSRRALELTQVDDVYLIATAKANMGFALIAQGRVEAGRKLADEAVSDYERSRATREEADLLGEYAQHLEDAGDYRTALALLRRQQKLQEDVTLAAREKAVLDIQAKYESEKRKHEFDLLNRENAMKAAELETRQLTQSVWWLLAIVFMASFAIVAVLYRKLRITNRLLGERNVELSVQSTRDPLTALYNRRHFQDYIGGMDKLAERRSIAPENPVQVLLLIDIDHFKQINDRYGHAAGDAVLVDVARRLRETLRETDMIVRWGGEEFLVFVPAAPVDRVDEIVLRIMSALAVEPFDVPGAAVRLTVSVGYTPLPLPPDGVAVTWERAITLADMALYMAKAGGRNRAYGIRALKRSDPAALAALDGGLEAAWRDGVVELQMLQGATVVAATPGIAPASA